MYILSKPTVEPWRKKYNVPGTGICVSSGEEKSIIHEEERGSHTDDKSTPRESVRRLMWQQNVGQLL